MSRGGARAPPGEKNRRGPCGTHDPQHAPTRALHAHTMHASCGFLGFGRTPCAATSAEAHARCYRTCHWLYGGERATQADAPPALPCATPGYARYDGGACVAFERVDGETVGNSGRDIGDAYARAAQGFDAARCRAACGADPACHTYAVHPDMSALCGLYDGPRQVGGGFVAYAKRTAP